MGQEIGIKEIVNAGSKVVNAAAQLAPEEPAVKIMSDIRGTVNDIITALRAGKELIDAKKELKGTSTPQQTVVVETAPRLQAARPPEINAKAFVELLISELENYLIKNPQHTEKKLGELLNSIKEKPALTEVIVRELYNNYYARFLDLSKS